ncbi:MAG TPA: 3-hydroxyacyl-CoA dehydrogenase family protein, partial [Candidatus Polarisedimenticolia bacterium]|nr:3-hydroxyacyl-CoA dehydrogenase family protein [Candidatus Polarisedimenticolia bacterium]
MKIRTVGVVGSGLMGSGIAQVSAQSGLPTVILDVSRPLVDQGMQRIEGFLRGGVDKGKLTEAAKNQTLSLLKGSTDLKDLSDCDLVVEAITENLQAKRDLFAKVDKICGPDTVFASNTSSLSITEMMSATSRPARFLGLHFFNPVPLMKLVEVIRTIVTAEEVETAALEFVR